MAKRAILIKGGMFLELAHKIDHLLVDKTGTFTFGKPKLMDIVSFSDRSADDILHLACIAEKYSEHPLGRAILAAGKGKGLSIPEPGHFTSAAGMGVEAAWGDIRIRVGKPSFFQDAGLSLTPQVEQALAQQSEQGRTAVFGVSPGFNSTAYIFTMKNMFGWRDRHEVEQTTKATVHDPEVLRILSEHSQSLLKASK